MIIFTIIEIKYFTFMKSETLIYFRMAIFIIKLIIPCIIRVKIVIYKLIVIYKIILYKHLKMRFFEFGFWHFKIDLSFMCI